jgi:predicted small lipoprotein YifL
MKKLIAIVLMLMLTLFLLSACGGKGNTSSDNSSTSGGNDNTPSSTLPSGNNNGNDYKVPDGVDYVEDEAYTIVWPNSGAATKIPTFSGVTMDDPWSFDENAQIMPVNVPRSQYDSYIETLESAGFSISSTLEDGSMYYCYLDKDNIYVIVDFNADYNFMTICVKIEV